MEQKTLKQIGLVVGTIGVGALVYLLSDNLLIAVGVGIGVAIFYESGEWLFSHCKLNSYGFFADVGKKGHSSIIEDDKLRLFSPYDDGVTYMCFRPGGSDLWWAPFHGMGDIYIAKEDLVKEEDGAIIVKGDWSILDKFEDLPMGWQKRILYKYRQDRTLPFNPRRHRVFYTEAYTPQINAYDEQRKAMNIKEQERFLKQEGIITALSQQLESLLTVMASERDFLKRYKPEEPSEEKPVKYKMVRIEEP